MVLSSPWPLAGCAALALVGLHQALLVAVCCGKARLLPLPAVLGGIGLQSEGDLLSLHSPNWRGDVGDTGAETTALVLGRLCDFCAKQ